MSDTMQFLADHGGPVLFAAVFIDQVGIPIPSVPWLMAAGALAGSGKLNLATALSVTIAACLIGDGLWFYLGRYQGSRVLSLLCRISLEKDSCVRKSSNMFERHGMRSVVVAKFIPGLGTIVPPLAGAFGITPRRFFIYDMVGSLLYGSCFLAVGRIFSNQLGVIGSWLASVGGWALLLIGGSMAAYIAYKYIQRHRLIRRLRIARVTPEEVYRKQEANEPLFILDLRSGTELKEDPVVVRGAVNMNASDVELRHAEIPRDRDVIVYCSCPNEATAARLALALQRKGITRVRPLLGGIRGWRERKYPTDVWAQASEVTELRVSVGAVAEPSKPAVGEQGAG